MLYYHCAGCWWWCNGVGGVFLAHFRPLSASWALDDHVHPFMATVYPSYDERGRTQYYGVPNNPLGECIYLFAS